MGYTAVTLKTLRQELEDKWESVPFWTTTEANNALNESLRVWNMLTGMWKRRLVFTLTANNPWVSLPSSLTYSVRVQFGESPLAYSSLGDLDNGRPGWDGETTILGGGVPTTPQLWAPAGLRLLAIWPADASGCGSLVIDGVTDTPFLESDTDYVDLGQAEHHAILGEALHVAAFKEGGIRFNGTKRFHQEFLRAALDQNSRLSASSYYRRAMGLDLNRYQRPMREKELAAT